MENYPAAPETTEDLLALAANVPALSSKPKPAPPAEPAKSHDEATAVADSLDLTPTFETTLTPSEIYSRAPHGLWRASAAAPKIASPSPASERKPRIAQAALMAQAASAVASTTGAEPAESESKPIRQSASTPSTILEAPALRETRPSESGRTGPTPATRKEIEAARAAHAIAQPASGGGQTTRRRVAMHRMAAAAATSLNEATPFRTSGSGAARFAGASGESIGESLDRVAEAVSVVPGLHLENVSLSAGYSSNGLPGARSLYGAQGGLDSDVDFGARATIAFRKRFRHSSFGLTYTPSRTQRNVYSQWNTTDHVLGIEYGRQIGRRWGLGLNAGAANTGLEQFWFRQPVYSHVENPPANLEELLQRAEAGEFTDDELASLMTGSPIVEDPGGRELDLTRVISLHSNATLSYAHSPRTTVTVGLGANRYETASRFYSRDASDRFSVNNISRQYGFVQTAYKYSPGVTTGVRYNFNNNDSNFGLSQSHSASGYVRKRLSRFWSAELNGGAGYVARDPDSGFLARLNRDVTSSPTWIAGGSLQYRYGGHSFRTFARRQVGDNIGLTSGTTLAGGLTWQWSTPRMPWVFSGGAQYSKSEFGFQVFDDSSTSYETSLLQAGVSRRLTPSTALSTGYYFGRYRSPLRGLLTGTSVHRVQATFLWRPVERY